MKIESFRTADPNGTLRLVMHDGVVVFRDYSYYGWTGDDIRRESVFVDGMD